MPTPSALVRTARDRIPTSEAELLLMHVLSLKRHELYLATEEVPEPRAGEFCRLVSQAEAGTPVQYLTGSAPFLDFAVLVDRRVLIPRPETEELVLRACERVLKPRLAIDYGTGSGCIAIALARRFGNARILAVDSSSSALEVARLNIDRFGLGHRIALVRARDLDHTEIAACRGRVDLLVSNPPYVRTKDIARLEPRVRNHEPQDSLDGGPKGTNILAMLVSKGPNLLAPHGLLALEIDPAHVSSLLRLAPGAETETDLAGRLRYLFLRKQTRSAAETAIGGQNP